MITLKDVTKVYGTGDSSVQALQGVSIFIEKGEFIAIVGTSGSGKSTLLHILGAMDVLTEGCYTWENLEVHELKGEKLHFFRREHVSFVFQQFALMEEYTVEENVELPLLISGIHKKERRKKVGEVLDKLGILDQKNKLPSQISGGQKQRCAIARALLADTPLILADEPTGALDTKNSEEVVDLLKECNKSGKTVIIVTHDMNIANAASRIIRLEDGRIVSDTKRI